MMGILCSPRKTSKSKNCRRRRVPGLTLAWSTNLQAYDDIYKLKVCYKFDHFRVLLIVKACAYWLSYLIIEFSIALERVHDHQQQQPWHPEVIIITCNRTASSFIAYQGQLHKVNLQTFVWRARMYNLGQEGMWIQLRPFFTLPSALLACLKR